jgi:hypothetical protein
MPAISTLETPLGDFLDSFKAKFAFWVFSEVPQR